MKEDVRQIKCTCDRCKKVYNYVYTQYEFKKPNHGWSEIHAMEILETGDKDRPLIPGMHRLDLCPDCTQAFKNFLNRTRGVSSCDDRLDLRKLDDTPVII